MRWYTFAAAVLVLVLAAAFLLGRSSRVLAQLTPWPTPPPGPVGTLPEVIPANEVTPVAAPVTPGGIAVQVDPIFAGPVPRNPPRPAVWVISGEPDPQDRIALEFDAGALVRTVQLTYEPVSPGAAPRPVSGQRVVRAFRLRLYDTKGAPSTLAFKLPVRMVLRPKPEELLASGNDAARLLVARYEEGRGRWLPLVTNYDPGSGTLLARIFQPGLYGLLAVPAPVS